MSADVAVFSVAFSGFAFALGLQVGLGEHPECAATVEGRRLIATDGSRCVYERPARFDYSPTELRRMASARERMEKVR